MLFTERMKKIELLVLKRDVDQVLKYLGFSGCVQLITDSRDQRELTAEEREIAELKVKIESVAHFLGIGLTGDTTADAAGVKAGSTPGAPEDANRELLRESANALIAELKDLVEEETRLVQLRLNLKQTMDELSAFAHLKVSFSELEHLTYLTFRLGLIDPERHDELVAALEKRALIVDMNKPGFIMAIAPKKGKWALDSELKKFNFQETKFPTDLKGIPADVLSAVQGDMAGIDESLKRIDQEKRKLRDSRGALVRSLMYTLDLDVSIDSVKQGLSATGSVQRVSGWVPQRRFDEVVAGLDSITSGRIALRSYEPEELPDVRSGKTKVPVSISHGTVVRSFERMVFSYSVPLYGTIDPTPFVAAMFVVLFAIMFGDVGQGLVGLVIGLLINSGWIRSFEKFRKKSFGGIFIIVGIASMVAGVLYGSFFANEAVMIPVSRFVSGWFGAPVDHILSFTGFQKIIGFFGFTIGVGVVINSVGLVINIVNNIKMHRWGKAFFAKTGLAGSLFFWYIIFVAVRILLFHGSFGGADLVAIAVPLLVIFLQEPLTRFVTGERPLLKDGFFGFFMEGIVEILESAIYYISNSVSFLRVAAFALAHTVLSSIVFLLVDMVGSAPGGIIYQIAVAIIGNLIIIVLEGLIVTIQVVRLEYYEFFSKFFTESGEEFKPFTLRTSGGSR